MRTISKRKAVSPVLATLLMIAVSVALAVVIFTWSQGFLSSTSSAVGTEQGAQNIAAQSQVAIENVITDPSANTIEIIIRNVGSVSATIGSIQIQGIPANAGLNKSVAIVVPSSGTITAPTGVSSISPNTASSYTLPKGSSLDVTVTFTGATGYDLISGDFITVKVPTTVGSFAQYSVTAP